MGIADSWRRALYPEPLIPHLDLMPPWLHSTAPCPKCSRNKLEKALPLRSTHLTPRRQSVNIQPTISGMPEGSSFTQVQWESTGGSKGPEGVVGYGCCREIMERQRLGGTEAGRRLAQ